MGDSWVVDGDGASQRLGAFLKDRVAGHHSAREVKRWIESNFCEVNGVVERFASHTLKAGDRVVLRIPSTTTKTSVATSQVLYQDDDIIAYNKPPGITSEALAKTVGKVLLVHRLDRDTSGVVIFAKNNRAKKAMEELFRRREVAKVYVAIVMGIPKHPQGVIKGYLGKVHSHEGQTIYGSVSEGQGLYAETSWRCAKRGENAAAVICYPKTGRTHQIRVHMKELGHPILGDYQYDRAQRASYRPQRHLLHAWKIAFPHPITGEKVSIQAPQPDDFKVAIKKMRIGE